MSNVLDGNANIAASVIDALIQTNRGDHHAFDYNGKRYSFHDVADARRARLMTSSVWESMRNAGLMSSVKPRTRISKLPRPDTVLPTQKTIDRLAERIERAFTIRHTPRYRGRSTSRRRPTTARSKPSSCGR